MLIGVEGLFGTAGIKFGASIGVANIIEGLLCLDLRQGLGEKCSACMKVHAALVRMTPVWLGVSSQTSHAFDELEVAERRHRVADCTWTIVSSCTGVREIQWQACKIDNVTLLN